MAQKRIRMRWNLSDQSVQITGFHQIVSGILADYPRLNRDGREVKEYMTYL